MPERVRESRLQSRVEAMRERPMSGTTDLRRLIGGLALCGVMAALGHGRAEGIVSALRSEASGADTRKAAPPPTPEHKISGAEARELFRSVDEILKFASKETGLPQHSRVKRRLVSRDKVVAYIEKHMEEDDDSQRMQRNSLVLKKFGLLPRDFDLKTFLVAMLREQVAGYYDPKTKTVNLLNWVNADQQKPVLAHELTHALQDQNFNLRKWMKAGDGKDLLTVENPTPAELADDEAGEARQAVVEGQATVALIDYGLAPFGQSMTSSPKLVEAMREGMRVGTSDSPQFKSAPLFLKEALTFPYSYGLDFVGQVVAKRGTAGAVDLFQNPPTTTRQIMEPATYLAGEKLPPLLVPDFKSLFKDFEKIDVGGFGEFDTAMLVDQFAGAGAGAKIYPEWRGGYYFAVKPKANPATPLGLLYVSRWSSAEKASEFAAIYAKSLAKRYQRADLVVQADGKPLGSADLENLTASHNVTGSHIWNTEEGPVLIDVRGDTVVVAESFADPLRFSKAVFAAMNGAGRK